MTARVLFVQHEADCPPAWFGEWMAETGVVIDVVQPFRGELLPEEPAGYDGLVVLGGEMGATDDQAYAWLAPTRDLVARTVDAGVPLLGICLGHQLASMALGGEIRVNPSGRAFGLTPVGLTDEGRGDELFEGLDPDAFVVQWNNDVVTRVPDGATVLARDPRGDVQALRLGVRAWGVQFHPEVNAELFRAWIAADPDGKGSEAPADPLPAAVADQIEAAEPRLAAYWRPFAHRFAKIVTYAVTP